MYSQKECVKKGVGVAKRHVPLLLPGLAELISGLRGRSFRVVFKGLRKFDEEAGLLYGFGCPCGLHEKYRFFTPDNVVSEVRAVSNWANNLPCGMRAMKVEGVEEIESKECGCAPPCGSLCGSRKANGFYPKRCIKKPTTSWRRCSAPGSRKRSETSVPRVTQSSDWSRPRRSSMRVTRGPARSDSLASCGSFSRSEMKADAKVRDEFDMRSRIPRPLGSDPRFRGLLAGLPFFEPSIVFFEPSFVTAGSSGSDKCAEHE